MTQQRTLSIFFADYLECVGGTDGEPWLEVSYLTQATPTSPLPAGKSENDDPY